MLSYNASSAIPNSFACKRKYSSENSSIATSINGDAVAQNGGTYMVGIKGNFNGKTTFDKNSLLATSTNGDASVGASAFQQHQGEVAFSDLEVKNNKATAVSENKNASITGGGIVHLGYGNTYFNGTADFINNEATVTAHNGTAEIKGGTLFNFYGGGTFSKQTNYNIPNKPCLHQLLQSQN